MEPFLLTVELASNGRCQAYNQTIEHFSIAYTFILCLRMPCISYERWREFVGDFSLQNITFIRLLEFVKSSFPTQSSLYRFLAAWRYQTTVLLRL